MSKFRHPKGRECFYYVKYSKVPNKRGVLISRGLEICVKYNNRGGLEYPKGRGGQKMVNRVPLRLVLPSRHLLQRKMTKEKFKEDFFSEKNKRGEPFIGDLRVHNCE